MWTFGPRKYSNRNVSAWGCEMVLSSRATVIQGEIKKHLFRTSFCLSLCWRGAGPEYLFIVRPFQPVIKSWFTALINLLCYRWRACRGAMKRDFYICNRTVEQRWITEKLLLSRLVFWGRRSQGHHNSPWSVGIKPQSDAFLWENERQKGLRSSGSQDSEYSNSFNQAVEKFRVEMMEVRNLKKKKKEWNHEPYASVLLPAKKLLITEFQSLLLFISFYMHRLLLPFSLQLQLSSSLSSLSHSRVHSGLLNGKCSTTWRQYLWWWWWWWRRQLLPGQHRAVWLRRAVMQPSFSTFTPCVRI